VTCTPNDKKKRPAPQPPAPPVSWDLVWWGHPAQPQPEWAMAGPFSFCFVFGGCWRLRLAVGAVVGGWRSWSWRLLAVGGQTKTNLQQQVLQQVGRGRGRGAPGPRRPRRPAPGGRGGRWQ
jgi:hypothetical protein